MPKTWLQGDIHRVFSSSHQLLFPRSLPYSCAVMPGLFNNCSFCSANLWCSCVAPPVLHFTPANRSCDYLARRVISTIAFFIEIFPTFHASVDTSRAVVFFPHLTMCQMTLRHTAVRPSSTVADLAFLLFFSINSHGSILHIKTQCLKPCVVVSFVKFQCLENREACAWMTRVDI